MPGFYSAQSQMVPVTSLTGQFSIADIHVVPSRLVVTGPLPCDRFHSNWAPTPCKGHRRPSPPINACQPRLVPSLQKSTDSKAVEKKSPNLETNDKGFKVQEKETIGSA
jgi:hypothetical protein